MSGFIPLFCYPTYRIIEKPFECYFDKVMASFEQKLEQLIAPVLEMLGCSLVRVRLMQAKSKILEIMIERIDGSSVSIDQCREVSNNVSAILDAEDVIATKYTLEVCSAGIERPLVKISDYERFVGRVAMLKLLVTYGDSKKIRGTIGGVEDSSAVIIHREATKVGGVQEEIIVQFSDIRDAHLVLTDELYREILAKQV